MFKKIHILMILVLAASCATKKTNNAEGDEFEAGSKVPKWVYAPNEVCPEAIHLCASSEGATLEMADLNAKKSLASIFETNIKSHFQVYTTSFTQQKRSEMTEQVQMEVQESLDVILQAVEVAKRFEGQGVSYSLVRLDRNKAKKILIGQIKDIDGQMNHLYEEKKKISINRLLILLDKRQVLNERLVIVDGKGIPTRYTYSKIMDLKYNQSESKVSLEYSEKFPKSLRKWLEGILANSGYSVVDEGSNYKIYLKLLVKPEYLNVQGFKKFTFVTEVVSRDNLNKQVGSFEVSQTVTGRNEEDAMLKIRKDLQNQINEKLNNLNIK